MNQSFSVVLLTCVFFFSRQMVNENKTIHSMSKVNQWEGLAFSYAVMGLAMKLGDDHPISGPLAKALNNKRGPMIESEQIENISKQIVEQVKSGLIKDDLLERMLKTGTFDANGGLISIGQDNIQEFIEQAQSRFCMTRTN